MERTITTFYQFADLSDFRDWKERLEETGIKEKVLGTIILAKEGINGTICGPKSGVDKFMAFIRSDERFAGMPSRSTFTSRETFYRLRIVTREEIVTLGVPGIDPTEVVGQYVEPEDWNALIKDPDVLLVDTRNDYEVELGTFKGALDPDTQNFSEWPDFVKDSLEKSEKRKSGDVLHGGHQVRESIFPPFAKRVRKSIIFGEASSITSKKSPPRKASGKGMLCFSSPSLGHSRSQGRQGRPLLRMPMAPDRCGPVFPGLRGGRLMPEMQRGMSDRKRESLRGASAGRTRPQAPRTSHRAENARLRPTLKTAPPA